MGGELRQGELIDGDEVLSDADRTEGDDGDLDAFMAAALAQRVIGDGQAA